MNMQNVASIPAFKVQHERHTRVRDDLCELISIYRGRSAAIIPFLGPTRCGKTELLHALVNEMGRSESGEELLRNPAMAIATMPPKPNDRDIYVAGLAALGFTHKSKQSTEQIRERLIRMIAETGTEILVFDEVSHCAERGANLSARAAADHFKTIADRTGIVLILAGLPKFQTLIDGNEQLRDRSTQTLYYLPYDWASEEDRSNFYGALLGILEAVKAIGIDVGLEAEEYIHRFYGASGGRVGMLLRIVDAALHIGGRGASLTPKAVKRAYGLVCQDPEIGDFFATESPSDHELFRAYAIIMAEAGLPIDGQGGSSNG